MRKKLIILSAFALIGSLLLFLCWNTHELYRFKQAVAREKVEGTISRVANKIQNRNGSLFNNFARSVFDKDFNTKMAFAAGFTHNSSKVSVTFDDNEPVKPAHADTVPVIRANKEFFKKNNIAVRPEAEMTLYHFDSMLKRELDSLDLTLSYRLTKFSRYDTAVGDTILSEPFIINFAQPDMYRANYVLPRSYVQRQMVPFVAASVLLLLLLVGGFIFVYRAYSNNAKSALFRQVLLGNFAHELKTPVTSLQLIMDGASRQENGNMLITTEHAGFADSEITRMKLLLDKMLSIGKMTREGVQYNREILLATDLVREGIEAMRTGIEKTNAAVSVAGNDGLRIEGDRGLLVNVITVLLDNAMKYGGTPPAIDIEIGRQGADAVITVRDNGRGIAPEYKERIFEPFFRVPANDVQAVPGHGLGLSFAREVLKLHKGRLETRSAVDGTVFEVILTAV